MPAAGLATWDRCHRCDAGVSEDVVHIFACPAARSRLLRMHKQIDAAARQDLARFVVTLPPAADCLPLPPVYRRYPLASVLFFFDPSLVTAAAERALVPGLSRATSAAQRDALCALARLPPLAGLLGIWPQSLSVALAVLLGLSDPTAVRDVRRPLAALLTHMRSIVCMGAFRIYRERCRAEQQWQQSQQAAHTATQHTRTRAVHVLSRTARIRRIAAHVCRGGAPPLAAFAARAPTIMFGVRRARSSARGKARCTTHTSKRQPSDPRYDVRPVTRSQRES